MRRLIIDEFWFFVAVAGPDDCWLWQRGKTKGGYGQVSKNGRVLYAHRVAYEIANGAPPSGVLRHSCDNPSCVNPAHLADGSQRDNMLDKVAKGRANSPRGETSGMSKLTSADVYTIRAMALEGWSHRKIAPLFGVSHRTIGHVINRKVWGHV